MKNFSDIKHRIKSVSDTRKITGAMETISVAKMRKSMLRYESNKSYFETIRRTIKDLTSVMRNDEHKVFRVPVGKCAAYLVVASDKGLAGGFNHNVLVYAQNEIRAESEVKLFSVGRMCTEYFTTRGISVDESFADASFDPSVFDARNMSEHIYKLFENDEIDSAYIVFTAMYSPGKTDVCKIRLLPFESDNSQTETTPFGEMDYDPSPEAVLEMLIPQYLTGMIYGALIQSSACEHSARRAAMSNATRNASELLEDLQVEYNRARQESVTNELGEIVTAANGVNYE